MSQADGIKEFEFYLALALGTKAAPIDYRGKTVAFIPSSYAESSL
jgi:hypothetical protein